jgi:hypothetical protein
MSEPPKSLKEPILPPLGLSLVGVISVGSAIAALAIFGYYFRIHGDPVEGRSLVFASFAVNSMIYSQANASQDKHNYLDQLARRAVDIAGDAAET